jgi:hypothetical protein
MPSIPAWKDSACPIRVYYSPETVEKIRRLALEGLFALPRVGLGVGGFLLGTRKSGKTTILDFHPIACSHASGPSFLPTEAEINEAKAGAEAAAFAILGYYCSRPHREVEFAQRDHALLDSLCPGAGQLALLVRPSSTEPTRAALFYRTPEGVIAGGTVRVLEPVELPEELPAAPEPAAVSVEPEPMPQPIPEPKAVKPQPPPPAVPAERRPELFGEPEPLPVPGFGAVAPRRSLPWRILLAAALVTALLIAGFLTRDRWTPRPPLELRTAETNGHFAVEWNRAAVRGIDKGVLTVTDGKSSQPFLLTASQLQAGTFPYTRQTPQVTAVLVAGDATAAAKFVAPPAPEPAPATTAPDTPEPSHP